MNMDDVKGKVQNAFGKTEEAVGKAVGSENLANAGAEDRLKGAATETWGGAKDAVTNATDHASSHATAAGHDASYQAGRAEGHVESGTGSLRDKIVTGAENFRDTVNNKIDNLEHKDRT